MTDQPPADIDEAVSAIVDGEASDDDVAAVAEGDGAGARVELFRTISDTHAALARSEVARSGGTDERIAAALAAGHGADPTLPESDASATRSVPVVDRRTRERSRRRALVAAVGGVAAAMVLIAAGLGIVRGGAGESTASGSRSASLPVTSVASGQAAPDEASQERSADKNGGFSSSDAASPTAVPSSQAAAPSAVAGAGGPGWWDRLPSLGDFPDRSQLVAAVGLRPSDLVAFDPQSIGCTPTVEPFSATTAARASLAGATVVVLVTDGDVEVLEPATCRILTG